MYGRRSGTLLRRRPHFRRNRHDRGAGTVNTPVMVVGMGVTGRAVATALVSRHRPVLTVDDHPGESLRRWVVERGINLVGAPELGDWPSLLEGCGEVVVSPGIPDRHPVFDAAHLAGVNIFDESDLAAAWDSSTETPSLPA